MNFLRNINLLMVILAIPFMASAQNFITVNADPSSFADYNDLQEAIDSASNGDVIYLYPSGASYGNIDVNKQLAIYGKGYFVGANAEPFTQATLGDASVGSIDFQNGSSGSIIQGITVNSFIELRTVSNIQIQHCLLKSQIRVTGTGSSASNITVDGCYIENNSIMGSSLPLSGLTIKNCIMEATSSITINSNTTVNGVLFTQNTVRLNSTCTTCNFTIAARNTNIENSLFVRTGSGSNFTVSSSYPPASVNNSIFSDSTALAWCATCIQSTANDLFQGYPSTSSFTQDSRYELAPSSPALGFGTGGADAGAFGGNTPYRLSGIPDIPNIYFLDVPSSGSSIGGLTIRIKANANE